MESDPGRKGNGCNVRPIERKRNAICAFAFPIPTHCERFADFTLSGAAGAITVCASHLEQGINRFLLPSALEERRNQTTFSLLHHQYNPEWKAWKRGKWRLEYGRGKDKADSERQWPLDRPTWRDEQEKAT